MMRLLSSKHPLYFFRLICNVKKKHIYFPNVVCYYATAVDIDTFTHDFIERSKTKYKFSNKDVNNVSVRSFMDHGSNTKDVTQMLENDFQEFIMNLISKNKDNQIEQLLSDCRNHRKFIGDQNIKKLLRHYSNAGKPDMIVHIQNYCSRVDPNMYRRGGKFQHYIAKAQCIRGNTDKGLSILKESYSKNTTLRSFYRIIFRELIQDAVINKSEASLVVLKRYVLEFSEDLKDHYPLVCFWHLCWSSSWFSDQQLADELLENSVILRNIVRDKATAFSITALKDEYNEDAVMRLLQALLKYKSMNEYVKVLQVLFNFKLRSRDIRGCREIIKNCEVLGVALPADQQGRYIKMLIQGKHDSEPEKPTDKVIKDFKLKF